MKVEGTRASQDPQRHQKTLTLEGYLSRAGLQEATLGICGSLVGVIDYPNIRTQWPALQFLYQG